MRGILISGRRGQPVLASASGRVIFSGTGIRSLGKVVVIRHNSYYLSVYGHNDTLVTGPFIVSNWADFAVDGLQSILLRTNNLRQKRSPAYFAYIQTMNRPGSRLGLMAAG